MTRATRREPRWAASLRMPGNTAVGDSRPRHLLGMNSRRSRRPAAGPPGPGAAAPWADYAASLMSPAGGQSSSERGEDAGGARGDSDNTRPTGSGHGPRPPTAHAGGDVMTETAIADHGLIGDL